MASVKAVLLQPNQSFLKEIYAGALRLMRSVRVVSENLDLTRRLAAASIYAVFQFILSKIADLSLEAKNLGPPTKGSHTEVNVKAAGELILDLLSQGNQGAGFCFERKSDSNNPVYYGAFYVHGGPLKMACLTKFVISKGLLVALVFDLYSNLVFKFKSRPSKATHLVCENLNLPDPFRRFKECLPAMLGILTGTRA